MKDMSQEQFKERTKKGRIAVRSAKECAYVSVFVTLVVVAQLAFSSLPGVELVTVLFISYAFVFGVRRGVLAGVAFALVRMLVFGFSPTVLILYLLYFPALAAAFGGLGHAVKKTLFALWWLVIIACVCTASFSLIDNLITPIWYGFTAKATKAYVYASLPFMVPQIVCTAISVSVLFLPLEKALRFAKKGLLK